MDAYAAGYLPPYNNGPSSSSPASSSSFSSDFDFSSKQDHMETSCMIRWNSGKKVDPRLLGMLEMFGEIYVERRDFFNKIFHGDHEEVFEKIGHVLNKKKSMKKTGSIKRNMSMKAFRQRGFNIEEENGANNEFRAQRFKIRTPHVIEAQVDES